MLPLQDMGTWRKNRDAARGLAQDCSTRRLNHVDVRRASAVGWREKVGMLSACLVLGSHGRGRSEEENMEWCRRRENEADGHHLGHWLIDLALQGHRRMADVARKSSLLLLCSVLAVVAVGHVAAGETDVLRFVVPDPSQAVTGGATAFVAPAAGRLVIRMSNPDSSRDSSFELRLETPISQKLEVLTCRKPNTGVDGCCQCLSGIVSSQVELNVTPGPIKLSPRFVRPNEGQDETGPDTLSVSFDPHPISFAPEERVISLVVGPFESATRSVDVTGPGTVVVNVTEVGTSGRGWFTLYLDGAPLYVTHMADADATEQKGAPHTLGFPVGAGSHVFTIAHEDTHWEDNRGERSADVYFIQGGASAPPETAGVSISVLVIRSLWLLLLVGAAYLLWRLGQLI